MVIKYISHQKKNSEIAALKSHKSYNNLLIFTKRETLSLNKHFKHIIPINNICKCCNSKALAKWDTFIINAWLIWKIYARIKLHQWFLSCAQQDKKKLPPLHPPRTFWSGTPDCRSSLNWKIRRHKQIFLFH